MTSPKVITLPKTVLFACSRNVIRSPMAAALARSHVGSSLAVLSAGLSSGELDPFALAVMTEIGISMREHTPRTLAEFSGVPFDLVVSLSASARDYVERVVPALAFEYWVTPDPSDAEGSREQSMAAYRQVRDLLQARIKQRFSPANA